MYERFGLFIDGAWMAGDATAAVESPVTEQVLGHAPQAGRAETEAAIAAAGRGLAAWSGQTGWERAERLHAVAAEMNARAGEAARMISAETGKPLAQSRREWALSTDQFRWYAEEARRVTGRLVESRAPGGRYEVHHPPVGIAAAFTAWNFPAVLIARKIAPALAAGCAVVARPSARTPGTAMVIFDCLRAGDLPAGTVNLLIGPTAGTYAPIMESAAVRKVSLTGSTRVGRQMVRDAADTMKRVSMELGGNAPLIIHDDADLEAALAASVPTKFANAGQVCVTPDRFFVHERLYEPFVEGFAERAEALKLGDGLDEETQMGPVISAGAREAAEETVREAVAAGARLVTGGRRPAGMNTGHFLAPTVLADVPDDADVFAEENFAPIAAITRFSGEDEAIARANASPMGLSAYCFTRSPERARSAVAGLNAGMVGINSFALAAAEVPFGGTNQSGMGREGGPEGIEGYLDTRLAQIAW